jgi:hypothetical protein
MTAITEEDKQRLTEYLTGRVVNGISGRDGRDLVDLVPSRSIFAGVLQPPRSSEIQAAQSGVSNRDAPAGTALGLDFRLKAETEIGAIRLRISPHWSLYYPVFPSYEEARKANELLIGSEVVAAQSGDVPTLESEVDEAGEANGSEATGDTTAVASTSGSVILPRKWRRSDLRPGTVSIELYCDRPVSLDEIGRSEIDEALQSAAATISGDPLLWRHLADPKERSRTLGDASVLRDQESYSRALAVPINRVSLPPWSVRVLVEAVPEPDEPGVLRVRILLANNTSEGEDIPDSGLEQRSLFDAGLEIEVEGGQLIPFNFWLAPKDYRSDPKLPAKGINCTAVWDPPNRMLRTETLPVFRQPFYRTREVLEVKFEQLSGDTVVDEVERLTREMKSYLNEWDDFLASEAQSTFDSSEISACKSDRDEFSLEIERFELGLETLRRDPRLLRAFRLMNDVFARLAAKSGGKVRAWRLFQVGFIVSQLPALAVRELKSTDDDDYSRAIRTALDEVAILWFPTGGGKTEAYLGLIAVALLYDRLRGKTRGVCAWMRFPLRMLSLQQMERLARVIAALNELRAEEPSVNIGDPFAIGYYVGDANTPNSLSEDDMRRYEQSKGLREEVRLLRKCPFCGNHVDIKPLRRNWRLAHVCSNASCFSNTSSTLGEYAGTLPVCIVDNEIYRYLPSVLVGTVDKLAIIARNRYFAHLVRGVKQRCAKHGYTSYGECIERWSGCKASGKELLQLAPLSDPGISLLIQDELHLLRAELGVFNGHYEGLLRYLGERAHLRPKVLAATATIEAYDLQAFHIYLSRARRYPQPAWRQGESFYATSKPEKYRRCYIGILGHTRGIEEAALRALELYQREVRRFLAEPRAAAAVMQRTDADDDLILDTLRLYDLSVCYVNRKSTGGSIVDKLVQVERHFESENLGSLKAQLLTGDQTIDEIGAALDRIEAERSDTGNPRLSAVVATNLISHGVDLERINMMVVCGMPSHYAEYVQSSSRAARSHPGLVFVCFKARDPRETSQYEFFPAMHEHMDRLIEAVAVNRFASFAPKKTVPGLIAGVLLCDITPDLYGTQITKPLDHVPTLQIALGRAPAPKKGTLSNCVSVDYIREAVIKIIGVDVVRPPAMPSQVENLRVRIEEVFDDQMGAIGRTLESQLKAVLNPITSFRDVDEGIDFGSIDSANFVTRLRAR